MSLAKQNTSDHQGFFIPKQFKLRQNYPNPFNPTTQIVFDLPQAGAVTLTVYDMTGRVVSTLVNGYKAAGRYDVTFDGTNLASGAYIYRLEAGSNFVETKKRLLVKIAASSKRDPAWMGLVVWSAFTAAQIYE